MHRVERIICILIGILCAFSAQAAAPYRAVLPDGEALVTDSGIFVVEPGDYEQILTIEPGKVYLAGETGGYRIIGRDGKEISTVQVSMARYTDDVIIFRWNGKYGAMDMNGRLVVLPKWTQLVSNGKDGYLALNDSPFDNVGDEIFYIDPEGTETPTGNYTVGTLEDVSEDRMVYMTTDGSYGFVDEQGRLVTDPLWLYAGSFLNGAAVVSDANGMGLVNTQGEMILDSGYVLIERNRHLTMALSGDGTLEVYTSGGHEYLFSVDAHGYSISVAGSFVALTGETDSLLFARDGRRIFNGSARASFTEGLNRQIIVSDGEWGEKCVWIMNPDGSAASQAYQQVLPLSGNRYAFLTMTGATYFSDALGGFQRSWDYESIRYGMLDGDGNEILRAEWTGILAAEDDRFILTDEDGTYLADESGGIIKEWLLPEENQSSAE